MDAPFPAVDAMRCPLCGAANACGAEAVATGGDANVACWCMAAQVPQTLLGRVPAVARGRCCICARCVAAAHAAAGGGTEGGRTEP